MSDLTKQFSSAELRRLAAQTGSGFISEALHYAAEVNMRSVAQAKRIAELEAEVARLRVDAERYRFLRNNNQQIDWCRNILNDTPQGIDKRVDSARKEPS